MASLDGVEGSGRLRERENRVCLENRKFVMNLDLACCDAGFNVIVFVKVCSTKAIGLEVLDYQGTE